MNGFWEIEAAAGPAREGLVGGGKRLLVRVTLFNRRRVRPRSPMRSSTCALRCARHLALELLAAAEDAEQQTHAAGFWETSR